MKLINYIIIKCMKGSATARSIYVYQNAANYARLSILNT